MDHKDFTSSLGEKKKLNQVKKISILEINMIRKISSGLQ